MKGGAENKQMAAAVGKSSVSPPTISRLSSASTDSPEDERYSRGCGNLPGCPGPTGFHNNHTFHFLRCCNTTKCNRGPGKGQGTQREAWDGAGRCTQGHRCSLAGKPLLSGSPFLPRKDGYSKSFKEGFCGNSVSPSGLTKTHV